MPTRLKRVILGLTGGASLALVVFAFWSLERTASQPHVDVLDSAEYQRLLAMPIVFERVDDNLHSHRAGLGEYEGGKPPVTPHPNAPAFGNGVKVAMTDAEFFQFYQAYQSPKHPVFVTSDSLIQAYFAVLREALTRAEAVEAWNLRDSVRAGLKKIDDVAVNGPPEVVKFARRLAKINLAIVARLFDRRSAPLTEASDEAIVVEEAARIEAAAETHLPSWLHAEKDDEFAIDYRMFRSVGERRSEWSKRRFRALKWLTTLPWRIDRDDHLLATLIAAKATEDTEGKSALRDQVGTMLMPPDDVDANQLAEWHGGGPISVERLGAIRNAAMKNFADDPPRLNDQIRFPPTTMIPYARWRSGGRGSDLVALKAAFGQHMPNGLALCASLGSSFARARPEANGWEKAPSLIERDNLSSEWWRAIALVLGPPPKSAPAFMESVEWRIKSCQTSLSGWVLWRHAVEAFGKSDMSYQSEGGSKPRGLVEPNPNFFRAMKNLADHTTEGLRRRKLLDSSPRRCAARIPDQLAAISKHKTSTVADGSRWAPHEAAIPAWFIFKIKATPAKRMEAISAALVQFFAAADDNRWPQDANAVKLMKMLDEPTETQLKMVATLADKCAELAEKQLAGKPFTDADDSWFLSYGRQLAGLAGYFGDADEQPVDDAMKVADVVYDAQEELFHIIAVGRPRALWVLYPYAGSEVLCRGAVFPYYEFDSPQKPADADWQKTVRESKQPSQPEWLKPLLRPGTAAK